MNKTESSNAKAKNHEKNEHDLHNHIWCKMFEPFITPELKKQLFFCCMDLKQNEMSNLQQDMIKNLMNNLKQNLGDNVEFGSELLKCKTVDDFLEFQRKNFDSNYQNAMKLYSDFSHDWQKLMNQNFKSS